MDQTQLIGILVPVTTPTIGYSGDSKWVLDIGATYHVCPKRDWFSNFEKLDGCFAFMGDDHPCKVEGIGTVRIKMFDGMVRELKTVICTSTKKESYLCWCLGSIKSWSIC